MLTSNRIIRVGCLKKRFFSSSIISRFQEKESMSKSLKNLLNTYNIEILEEDFEKDLTQPLVSHLYKRGLIETCVNEEQLVKELETDKLGLYCGADPTAKSLHLGNLLPLMVLLHFNIRGHNVSPLIGGATGSVGDPSGRTTERDVMAQETRLTNVERISQQFIKFFKNGLKYGSTRNPLIQKSNAGKQILRNNHDWWKDIGMLEFLAKYGRFIRVNQMLGRDSVKSRLTSEQGLGFNEFTYQILQAFDFYYLNKNLGVDIQVGGNDQYGNIVAGVDLITRMKKQEKFNQDKECFGLTVPLLTTSNGVKFGKSAGNAIFIDKELTSSYNIYQFMFNTTDADVKRFLYKFSLLPTTLIDRIIEKHDSDKRQRIGQKVLAIEMCDLIHGDGEGFNNFIISEILFGKDSFANFNADEILHAFKLQNMVIPISRNELEETNVGSILYKVSNGEKSKSEFRRMIKGGSVYIGNDKSTKFKAFEDLIDLDEHLIEDKLLLLRVGKQYYVIEVV